MPVEELLVRWTVRLAMALYVLSLGLRLAAPRRWRTARAAWVGGYLAFVVHVGCAFHFVHGWSHADAYAETARQTREVVGLDWGGGLWANYACLLVWGGDALWWITSYNSYLNRPRWMEGLVQGYLGFLAFNATVVFGQGMIRWAGVAACALLILAWRWRSRLHSASLPR